MTRKDYEALAAILYKYVCNPHTNDVALQMYEDISEWLAEDNPRFNAETFRVAATVNSVG